MVLVLCKSGGIVVMLALCDYKGLIVMLVILNGRRLR